MNKKLGFDVNEQIEIQNEALSGVLLDFGTFTAGKAAVCNISDLNKIAIDVIVKRKSGETILANGYLEDYLRGLYEGTPKLAIFKSKLATGYLMPIEFKGNIAVSGTEKIIIKMRIPATTFTSVAQAESTMNIESIPTVAGLGRTAIKIVSEAIPSGDVSLDKTLPANTVKTVMALDYDANYLASAKAKAPSIVVKDGSVEVKNVSENLMYLENSLLHQHSGNDVGQLIIYSGRPLKKGRVQCKFDQAVDNKARLISAVVVLP